MSMYSELLLAALDGDPSPAQPKEQLAHLVACRRRLGARATAATGVVPADELADNLAYDLALIEMCRSRGIECGARLFGRPLVERKRLEGELAKLGIDLGPGGAG